MKKEDKYLKRWTRRVKKKRVENARLTKNLLLEKTCDNCFYSGPKLFYGATRACSNLIRKKTRFNNELPEVRTCRYWASKFEYKK